MTAPERSSHPEAGWSETAHSAFRGAVAAMSMSGMRIATVGFGLLEQTPPGALGAKAHSLLSHVMPERRLATVELMHIGYGAAGGALFGMLPERLRRRAFAGPMYGLVLWLGFEAVLAPVFGVWRPPAHGHVQRLALVADHMLYGLVLSEFRSRPQR